MKKISVTAVSYLNTKPFLYGIFQSKLDKYIDLKLEMPSACARSLSEGSADLGLVPVAVIPQLKDAYIVSDYCIGTVGAVKTVCIYSHCPIEAIETLYLDYQSRSSVQLAQILLRDHWQLQPRLLPAEPGYEAHIGGRTAGLIIGDRTIGLEARFPYVYDLGEAWQQHTGLPFVFAAWVSQRPLDDFFIEQFNDALALGLSRIPQLVYLLPPPAEGFNLFEYFTKYISYQLDEPKKMALERFLHHIGSPTRPIFPAPMAV